jgi:uncharacterized membrane protein (UPF0127 family)
MFRRLLLTLLALLALAAPVAAADQNSGFSRSTLEIVTADGRRLSFSVELAQDDGQRALGLMYRQKLATDAGMLFDFRADQDVSMWMKNTFIPLDMIFVRADGTIHRIAERTVPHSLEIVSSQGKVRAVLELNGGTAARLGIRPGDRLSHPLFGGR